MDSCSNHSKIRLNGAHRELEALVEINFFSFFFYFSYIFLSFCLTRIGTPQNFRSNRYKMWPMEFLQQTLKIVQNLQSSDRQFSEPNLKILNSPNWRSWGRMDAKKFSLLRKVKFCLISSSYAKVMTD